MVVFILPVSNDREKYRIAGNKTGPAMLGQVHPFRRPCMSSFRLPAMVLDFFLHCDNAGGATNAPPARLFQAAWRTLMFFPRRRLYRSAVCPCQGSGLRTIASKRNSSKAHVRFACLLVSLDNSCPPNSDFLRAKKHALGEMGIPARPGACGVLYAENLIMLECPHMVRA